MHPLEAETVALLGESGLDFNPYIVPANLVSPGELGTYCLPDEVEDEAEED